MTQSPGEPRYSVLETTDTCIVVQDENGDVDLIPMTRYNQVKYASFGGRDIRWSAVANGHCLSAEETAEGFRCKVDEEVAMTDQKEEVAEAIHEYHADGRVSKFEYVWNLSRMLNFLSLSKRAGWEVNVQRNDNTLELPRTVRALPQEMATYTDGSRVAKVLFVKDEKDTRQYGVFPELVPVALALVGRDETRQPWVHFLPPDYAEKSIEECEKWLCGCNPGDDAKIVA